MAAITHTINATTRTILGSKVKKLRLEGKLPANMYGKGLQSVAVETSATELSKTFFEVGESALVNVILDGKETIPVLFRNPEFDRIDGYLLHLDMYRVNMKEKITTDVPVKFTGEAPAVKQGLLLMEVTVEVGVECLPANLPEHIEVDISGLEKLDDMITVADLKLSKEIEVMTEGETVLIKVIEAQQAEVVEETSVDPTAVVATAQKTEEEKAAVEDAKKTETKKE